MSKLVNAFFSPADREAIVAAVTGAEARTSAEIVPMVVEASDGRRMQRLDWPALRQQAGAPGV